MQCPKKHETIRATEIYNILCILLKINKEDAVSAKPFMH